LWSLDCCQTLADGFHSSASDPVLQQKYGHVIEKPSIAPPPTGQLGYNPAATTAPMSIPIPMQPQVASTGIYSRYVPYDAHNNTAAPIPQPLVNPYSTGMPSSAYCGVPPPTFNPGQIVQQQQQQPSTVLSSPIQQPPFVQLSAQQPTVVGTSRFLGNKGPIAASEDIFNSELAPITRSPTGSSPGPVF
jgi:hypothetical protein